MNPERFRRAKHHLDTSDVLVRIHPWINHLRPLDRAIKWRMRLASHDATRGALKMGVRFLAESDREVYPDPLLIGRLLSDPVPIRIYFINIGNGQRPDAGCRSSAASHRSTLNRVVGKPRVIHRVHSVGPLYAHSPHPGWSSVTVG